MQSDQFLCVRCARRMKTCCQWSEIYATPGDVQRIARYTGRYDFAESRIPADPDYLDLDDDPTWWENVFRADHSRRVLQRRENGDCTFLGEHGCTLPLEVRPLICRLYPFRYTAAGIRPDLAQGCPMELLRPGESLIEALDMNLADARHWHRQLYHEIRVERDPHGEPRLTCVSD